MYIVHVGSELAPIAKVGGLGDVLHGLSKELIKLGHKIQVILPKYDCIYFDKIENLRVEEEELWSYEGPYKYNNTIWSGKADGIEIILIEPHHPAVYFSRGSIYGEADDTTRFAYFSRTALEYLFKTKKQPDVVHVHDWPTALIPVLYKEIYVSLGMKMKSVLTLHNMEHQGKCPPAILTKLGLRGDQFLDDEKMQDPLNPKLINLLKGGIEYADKLTTVSPNYEKEIINPIGGFHLDKILFKNKAKLKGILNGIDETVWDSTKDPYLAAKFSVKNVKSAKKENKRQLQTHFKLKQVNVPMVASVTRLASQKAPDLIIHAIKRTLEAGGQFILLGSGSAEEQEPFLKLEPHPNLAINLNYNEALAHLIFGGADMFVIPSLFEPCGLTQMIALHYGTVPIARKTGGLADTVFDEKNGFTFDFPDTQGVDWALSRAFDCYHNNPQKWLELMQHGMATDFSWKKPAAEYVEIYKQLI